METFIRYNHMTHPLNEGSLMGALQSIREQKIIALETKLRRMRNPDNKAKVKQEIRDLKQTL